MISKTVTIHEAKTTLSKLIAELESGSVQEIVVARDKEPVARLVPMLSMKERRARSFGAMKGKFEIGPEFFEPLPEEELKLWGIE